MEESFWKQTYEKILIGMGLFGITLKFLFLNQILPFIGALLLFTGFRKLRSENRWLKAGYAGAALKVVITIVNIVIGSVLEREKIYVSYVWKVIVFCGGILPVFLMVCLFLGMREELEKRKAEIKNEVLLHIIIWYVVVTVLAVREYEGWILGLAIVAAYIGILVELKNIAEKLEQAEYVLEEHPVRISDGRYAAGAAILTAAGLLIGYTCFGSYHMAWTTAKETQDSASEEIKAHLLSLGFPEEILHDLKEEDILACKNARQILLNQSDDLLRDGDERLQLDGVAVVDKEKCVACGKCVAACPKGLIQLVPYSAKHLVQCSSHDKGKDVKAACQAGCIGCTLCTRQCESDAIHMDNNLAVIDYDKCTNCGKCAEKCPAKVILEQE